MPIEVRPIDPRDRRRKKLGRRGLPKPTKMGKIEQRPTMTIGQKERLRAISRERDKNEHPDGSDIPRNQLRPPLPPEKLMKDPRDKLIDRGMLTGGQAKLDKNKNNKIDAQDFKILRAEKAKGRGKGLQDEKMKPGKMMKARKGTIIKPKGPGVIRPKPQDRYGQPLKPKPIKPAKKMGGGMMKKPMGYDKGDLARLIEERDRFKLIKNPARTRQIQKEINEIKLQKKVDRDATINKARASINKIKSKEPKRNMLAGMSDKSLLYAVANAAKDKDRLTSRDMELLKQQAGKFKKMGGGLTEATQRLKAQGKMGGGMMKKPMGYKKGMKNILPKISKPSGKPIKKFLKSIKTIAPLSKKMGGGMMMRPNPVGMKSGKSVKVKCKLGRNKPTKMY